MLIYCRMLDVFSDSELGMKDIGKTSHAVWHIPPLPIKTGIFVVLCKVWNEADPWHLPDWPLMPSCTGQWSIGHACTATQLWKILADPVRAANVSPESLEPKVIVKYLKNAHARGERRTGSRLSHFNWYSLRYKWFAWILHYRLASFSIQVLPMVWQCGSHPALAGSSKCGNNSKPVLPQRQSSGNWNRW